MATMLQPNDITQGTYLRQLTNRFGGAVGLIAVVDQVGNSWTGQWCFRLRYLNRPVGMQTKAASPSYVQLREEDLTHFELVGTWIPADALLVSAQSSVKPRIQRGLSGWRRRRKIHLHQLRLFDEY